MKVKKKTILKRQAIINALLVTVILALSVTVFFAKPITEYAGSFNDEVIYKGNENSGGVALTFNVYQNTDCVEKILSVLDKKSAKATFFLGGCWADDNVSVVNKIVQSGHEVGSHGYYHKDHAKLSYEENLTELKNTETLLYSIAGVKVRLFAPPSGSYQKDTLKACKTLGYRVIMWSNDTIDWRDQDKNLIIKRALKNPSQGNIVLMHPTPTTADALEFIIDGYRALSIEPKTLSEVIKGV